MDDIKRAQLIETMTEEIRDKCGQLVSLAVEGANNSYSFNYSNFNNERFFNFCISSQQVAISRGGHQKFCYHKSYMKKENFIDDHDEDVFELLEAINTVLGKFQATRLEEDQKLEQYDKKKSRRH